MKKTLLIIGAIVLLIAIALTCVGIYFIGTPEYALIKIVQDIDESGIEGLRPHLTEDAQKIVDAISTITENEIFGVVMGLLSANDYLGTMKSEIQEIQWNLEDVVKGNNYAEVIVGFNYDNKLIGTIALSMIRDNGQWKIDGLELPKFDEINY